MFFFLLSFSFFFEYFFFSFKENLGNNALELVTSPTRYRNGEIAVFVSYKKGKMIKALAFPGQRRT